MKNWLLLVLGWLAAADLLAHQNSTAYLSVQSDPKALHVRWEIPVRDLEFALGLDRNHDGKVTWGEIQQRFPEIRDYTLRRLQIRAHGPLVPLALVDILVNPGATGSSLVLILQAPIHEAEVRQLRYSFGFDFDPGHQCLASLNGQAHVLTRDHATLELANAPRSTTVRFIRLGTIHIFERIDHICFLLALMLPSVWRRTVDGWQTVSDLRSAFVTIARLVTAFTVAHTVTLAASALHLVTLPTAFVESVIAFSVIIAALNNLWPWWSDRSWMVAFGFGLIHGFGFASALSGIPTGSGSFALGVAGFNLGVELGQLCIVLAFVPLAFAMRGSWFYRWVGVRAGSIGIASVATIWLVERAFHVTIF